MAISQYKTVFNEKATMENMEHLFMVLNNKNDKQIVFRDFAVHLDNVGLNYDKKEQRKVFDTIARTVKKGRSITKDSWIKGIMMADHDPKVKATYRAIIGGKQYDPQMGRDEIDLDEIRVKLQDLKAPWMYRVECMQSLCRQLCINTLSVDKFHKLFNQYHISLTKQAKDRRSNVCRVACEAFAKIILFWKGEFLKYSYTTIEYIYELIRQKIAIVHESGMQVLVVLFRNCGDHKHCKMMDILGREGTTSKFENLKKDCFDLLLLYLAHQNAQLKSKDEFWNKLIDYTKKGVNDTAQVRNYAMKLLAQIQCERANVAKKVIDEMGTHLRKRYDREFRIIGGRKLEQKFEDDDDDWDPKPKIKRPKSAKASKSPKTFWGEPPKQNNKKSARFRADTAAQVVPKTPPPPSRTRQTRSKSKAVPVAFPVASKGEFLNGFGEKLGEEDILFAFEFVDTKKDRKITMDEFKVCCDRLNVNGNIDEMFRILDKDKSGYMSFTQFKSAIASRNGGLMDFWYKLLSGKDAEGAPMYQDLEFDEAHKLLINLKNQENTRLKAMYSITRKICRLKKYENAQTFEKQFKKSMSPLLAQLKDRNNTIVREVCICFGKIFMAKKALYKPFAIRTFENILEAIKLQDYKTTTSAKQAGMCLIKNCPDRNANPLMKMIREGCCDKRNVNVRCAGFEYINYYLFALIKSFDDKKAAFWDYLEAAIKSGLNDSDPTARDLVYCALVKVEVLNKGLSAKYISTLKKARKEKYDAIKKDELRRVQSSAKYRATPSRPRIKSYTPTSSSIRSPIPKRNPRSPRSPRTPDIRSNGQKGMTFAKATKLLKNEKKITKYKIHKRPKDDTDDDRKYAKEKLRLEKRRSINEEKEKKEKAEKERKERENQDKVEQQKLQKRKSRGKDGFKLATAKKLELQQLEKEEQEAMQMLEKIRLKKEKVQKEENKRHEQEKQRRKHNETQEKFEKLEQDRLENERKQKVEQQRMVQLERERQAIQHNAQNAQREEEQERIQRQRAQRAQEERLQRERAQKAQEERFRTQRMEQERIERENAQKAQQERVRMQRTEQERNERIERERAHKAEEEKERGRKRKIEEEKNNARNNSHNESGGNDYGFPNVFKADEMYFVERGARCTNPTHLVLFCKKQGIGAVSFSKVSKYFKAKKGK